MGLNGSNKAKPINDGFNRFVKNQTSTHLLKEQYPLVPMSWSSVAMHGYSSPMSTSLAFSSGPLRSWLGLGPLRLGPRPMLVLRFIYVEPETSMPMSESPLCMPKYLAPTLKSLALALGSLMPTWVHRGLARFLYG